MKKILISIFCLISFALSAVDYNAVLWEYNKAMQLEKMTEFADTDHPRRVEYLYGLTGKVEKIIKPDGTIIDFTYDFKDRLKRTSASDGSLSTTYYYDLDDQIKHIDDTTLRSIPFKNEVVNTYDKLGNKILSVFPDGSSASYTYSGKQLSSITRLSPSNEAQYTINYQWNKEGKVKTLEFPKPCGEIKYKWDHRERIQSIISPVWSEEIDLWNGYNKEGNLVDLTIKDHLGKERFTYKYDNEGRLTKEKGKQSLDYAYDPLNNITSINKQTHLVDAFNQTIETPHATYTYDANGNMITKTQEGQTFYFSYDALDRMTQVIVEGKMTINYKYDPNNRRLSKTTTSWDGQDTQTCYYIYDGSNEVGSMNENGEIVELRILGLGLGAEIGASVAIEINSHTYFPIHDHRGNAVSLIDSETGKLAESCRYTAFGSMQAFGPSINPWKFYSKRYEKETGFTFFGKRYYSHDLGKWTTPDPLGYGDNANRYIFLNNNPVNSLDLYGLFSISAFWNSVKIGAQDWFNTFRELANPQGTVEAFDKSINDFCEYCLGPNLSWLTDQYAEQTHQGIHPGKSDGKVKISFINGILCNHAYTVDILDRISESYDHCEIYYVCRGSQGWTRDILKGFFVKMGLLSHEAYQLAAMWKKMINDLGGPGSEGTIIHYAHSIGATETIRARKLMSPEELKMIQVIAVGPASIVPDEGFQSSVNYISVRDGVCYLDPISYIDAMINKPSHVIFLGAHSDGYPFFEHIFQAYWNYLKDIFEKD